jgi:hypothetical protein
MRYKLIQVEDRLLFVVKIFQESKLWIIGKDMKVLSNETNLIFIALFF